MNANHRAVLEGVTSVRDIVNSTSNKYALTARLKLRTQLLWTRAGWIACFIVFWVLIVLTLTNVIDSDFFSGVAVGLIATGLLKWFFGVTFCDKHLRLSQLLEITDVGLVDSTIDEAEDIEEPGVEN